MSGKFAGNVFKRACHDIYVAEPEVSTPVFDLQVTSGQIDLNETLKTLRCGGATL